MNRWQTGAGAVAKQDRNVGFALPQITRHISQILLVVASGSHRSRMRGIMTALFRLGDAEKRRMWRVSPWD
jgi:hypothetical protein